MKVIYSVVLALFLAVSAAQAADYGACSEVVSSKTADGGAAMEIYHFAYSNTSGTLTLYDPNGMRSVWQGTGPALGDRGSDGFHNELQLSFMAEMIDAVEGGRFFYVAAKEGTGWKAHYAFVTSKDMCVSSFFPLGVLKLADLPEGIQERLKSAQ